MNRRQSDVVRMLCSGRQVAVDGRGAVFVDGEREEAYDRTVGHWLGRELEVELGREPRGPRRVMLGGSGVMEAVEAGEIKVRIVDAELVVRCARQRVVREVRLVVEEMMQRGALVLSRHRKGVVKVA